MVKDLKDRMKEETEKVSLSIPMKEAVDKLLTHKDPSVRAHAVIIREGTSRRKRILELIQEALQQLRLDMKYISFDLEATRRERDALK